MHEEQPVDHFALFQGALDDFRHIGNLDFGVEDVARLDVEQGTHLAEPLAAGFGDVGAGVFFLFLEFKRDIHAGFLQGFGERVADFERAVRDAAGSGADDDAALDPGRRGLVIVTNFFEIDGFHSIVAHLSNFRSRGWIISWRLFLRR